MTDQTDDETQDNTTTTTGNETHEDTSTEQTAGAQTEQTSADQTDQQGQQPAEDQNANSPNREAAKYRARLREVEAERDNLQEQLTATTRRAFQLEHKLSDRQMNYITGTTTAELKAEHEKFAAFVNGPVPIPGSGTGDPNEELEEPTTWQGALEAAKQK